MTRQEAIKELELIKARIEWEYPLEYQIAFDMAIKALEQEPCEDKRTNKRTETHACDCISRQDAIDAVVYDGITTLNADERKLLIEQIPSAEPKRGKWIKGQLYPNNIYGNYHAECTNCGKVRIIDNFCPNCGARMESDE